MGSIDWKAKLSSRKFWCVLIAFVGAVLASVGLTQGSIERVTSVMGAFATLIVYILVEGNVDAKATIGKVTKAPVEATDPPDGTDNG